MTALVTLAVAALAHDEEGELVGRPFVRGGELVGVLSSSGLTLRDPDGVFRRVCREALPSVYDAWRAADGTILIGGDAGLFRSSDAGCGVVPDSTWTRAIGRFVPVGDTLYALVDPYEGPVILRSDDDGATFAELPPLPNGRWYVYGLAGDGAGRLVVAGLTDSGFDIVAWDGVAYTSLGVPADPKAFFIDVLGPAPSGSGVVVATTSFGPAHLWVSSELGWTSLVDVPSAPIRNGFGCVGGACFVASGVSLHRWEVAAGASSLREVEGPIWCAFPIDGAVWGCAERLEPALVEVSRDGSTFEPALAIDETLERECSSAVCVVAPPPDTGSGTGDTSVPEAKPPTLVPRPRPVRSSERRWRWRSSGGAAGRELRAGPAGRSTGMAATRRPGRRPRVTRSQRRPRSRPGTARRRPRGSSPPSSTRRR